MRSKSKLSAILILGGVAALAVSSFLGARSPENPLSLLPATSVSAKEYPDKAPQFIGAASDWLNTSGKTLDLKEELKKHPVILIDFWEYTCVNCIRTMPYLKEWNKRYAKEGLLIVGIHTPEFEFARDRKNVEQAVKQFGIEYPVLIDSAYKNWNAYGNRYWPRKYLIDAKGKIVYDHAGEGDYDETEKKIQELLRQANPKAKLPPIMQAVRAADKPGAVCYPKTPEIYAGYERGQLGNANASPNQAVDFVDPGRHVDGTLYAQGRFTVRGESVLHARQTEDASDYIALKYHAKEANAVLKPEKGKSFRLYLTQDGKPIAKTDKGADVQYDEQGRSFIEVSEPRMYSLTINARHGSHELKLMSAADSFALYSFTFSSCDVAE